MELYFENSVLALFGFCFSGLEMEVCFLGIESIIQKKSEVGFVNSFILVSKFGWVLQLLDLLLWVHESSIFFFLYWVPNITLDYTCWRLLCLSEREHI